MDVFTLPTQISVIGFIITIKVLLNLSLAILKIWDAIKEEELKVPKIGNLNTQSKCKILLTSLKVKLYDTLHWN